MSLEKSFRNGDSFTALLELPLNQAVKLLHSPDMEMENSSSIIPSNSSFNGFDLVKQEFVELESGSMHNSSRIRSEPDTVITKSTKRKDREKVKSCRKKMKSSATEIDNGEKLPYVHVRARRGEATDSHSLAERARREKINDRMKLLQELVPGCNKIAGTTMVLDEIISHVQSLQLQVESGSPMDCNFTGMVSPGWGHDGQDNGNTQPMWHHNELNNLTNPENY